MNTTSHIQHQPIIINNNTGTVNIDNSGTTKYIINIFKFIEIIIVEHTQHHLTACLLDSLGYQHSNRTIDICNKHYITVYRIPPKTTGWLQPYDIVLFGPAKQKVCKQHKLDRQSDISPTLQRTCQQFSVALNAVSNSAVKRTWDGLKHIYT